MTTPAVSMIDIPVPGVRVLYSWVDPSGATPRIFPAAAALVVLNPVPPFAGLRGVPNESDVALAAPRVGVTSVGLVANTNEPEPVSSVTAAAKLAELGVAKNVATLAARPLIPVLTGRFVQLVRVPEAGVPRVALLAWG